MSERILLRVKQLLALSDGNANVNEAANAYKAAQKLLAEHRLSMADVEATDDSLGEAVEEAEEGLYTGKRSITWKGSLAMGIAQCNGCDVYWSHSWESKIGNCKKLTLVGRPADIEIVRWLYYSVSAQIEGFCKAAQMLNPGRGKTFSNNFKRGAANTVIARLQEAKREVEQKYDGTAALVLVRKKDEDVAKFMASLGLRKTKSYSRYDADGYAAGAEAGKRVNLSRGGLKGKAKGLLT